MSNSKSTRVVVAIVLAATGLVASLSANHAWGNYHWARTTNPLTLQVGDNVTNAWDSYLNTAILQWNKSTALSLVKVAGGTKARTCKPTAGRIEVCNERYGFNGWLGIAQIWITGNHITQAVTKLNDSYFSTSTYNKAAWRNLVMCQEIGHDFGLGHQDEDFDTSLGSCMDYSNDPVANQYPNAHDYAQLQQIYGHTDSTTTAGSTTLPRKMPPAMGQISFDTRSQWGRLVAASRNGRKQVFELDFGGGNKVVTHVFWADPDADEQAH